MISSVSGGSVLAAMYAYTDNSFEEFDASIVKLLRRGLVGSIARAWMRPHAIAKTLASIATTGPVSLARTAARILPTAARKATALLDSARPIPIRRFYSRTEAFRDAIASLFFRSDRMGEVKRPGLDVVINATELRTGSAFRFGSRQSGCSRVGIIPPKDALVADAVAASAAYPVLLPALDREYRFRDRGEDRTERVLLTDGGIFENLGVSPMEPGRNPSISTNVFNPDYIISCDAGDGLLDDDAFPAWWPTRMKRSFLVTFRKTQDATRKRLHEIDASGEISGFILAYLGQNDRALPWRPADLPPRAGVYQYSTNFFAMDDEDMERLMLRGELLTRLLISHYHPEL